MNRLTSTLLAGTVLASASFTASASSWGGFYAGAFFSLGESQNDWRGVMGPETISRSLEGSDAGGGIFGGYNFEFGNFVVGIEGEAGAHNATRRRIFAATFDGTEGFDLESSMNVLGSVRGRVGFTFQDALFYALAGAAFTDLQQRWIGRHFLTSDVAGSDDAGVGFVFGGGFDLPLSECLALRGEVAHYDFGSASGQPGGPYSEAFSVDQQVTQMRVGISYQF